MILIDWLKDFLNQSKEEDKDIEEQLKNMRG